MHLVANQHDLERVLAHAMTAVDRKSAIPTLLLLRVEALDNGTAKVGGSSLQLSASARFRPVKAEEAGVVAVDAHRLLEVVAGAQAGKTVTLKTDGQKLQVRCGQSRYVLPVVDAQDFPSMPRAQGDVVEVQAGLLVEPLAGTAYAQLEDDNRAHLAGIRLTFDGKTAEAVSTDGLRLARLRKKKSSEHRLQVFAPYRAVAALRKLCANLGDTDAINLAAGGPYLHAWTRSLGLACKLVEMPKLDYDKVVPDAAALPCSVVVDRHELQAAIERMRKAMPASSGRGVRLFASSDTGKVELTFEANECSGREACKADVTSAGEVVLKIDHVADVLQALGGERVTIAFEDGKKSVLLSSAGRGEAVGVLWPIQESEAP